MLPPDVQAQIDAELAQAEIARQTGLAGRARVIARRSAGIAVRSFLLARGTQVGQPSLLDWLQIFHDQPETPLETRQILEHLLERVNPDFTLPAEIDLIQETRKLIEFLNKDG